MMNHKKIFFRNLIFSFGTQIISIIVSLIMTLGLPKILTIEDYGYWQLFIFYGGFVGFFQLGFSDGLYLKYGGSDFNNLNKRLIKSQLLYLLYFQIFIGSIIIVYIYISNISSLRFNILISFSIFLVIANLTTWLGYLLLSTNKIVNYSKSVIIEKVCFLILLACYYCFHLITLNNILIIFFISKLSSLLFLMWLFKPYFSVKNYSFLKSLKHIKNNISTGSILMFSNIASTLILGIGRFAIDDKWDIQTFGKVSLALSSTFFFLLLISQISFSLFPILRQIKEEHLSKLLKSLSYLVSNFMLGVFICYFPLVYILQLWLPKYLDSLQYLIILMPICLYEGKMQMIFTTYLKAINKQNILLFINLSVLLLSVLLTFISAYVYNSIFGVLFSMLITITMRSVITNLYLYKFYKLKFDFQIIIELIFIILFIVTILKLELFYSFLLYTTIYILYVFIIKNKFLQQILYFRNI